MSRLTRVLMLTALLHHIEGVCRPSAPPVGLADFYRSAVARIMGGLAEHAEHRIALAGFRAPDSLADAVTSPRPAVAKTPRPAVAQRPARSTRPALPVAPAVQPALEQQLRQHQQTEVAE